MSTTTITQTFSTSKPTHLRAPSISEERKQEIRKKLGYGPSKKRLEVDDVQGVLSFLYVFFIYFAYTTILITGYVEEYFNKFLILIGVRKNKFKAPPGYAPLYKELEYFWLNRVYQRIRDLFERPVCGVPGCYLQILERVSPDSNFSYIHTGKVLKCLNLGSYNYLGFAENSGSINDSVVESIDKYWIGASSPRLEAGNLEIISELEKTIARFVGKPAALVIGMGFATNSTNIPILAGKKGTLIISDTLNHNSIVTGARDSNHAVVRVFKHNDPGDLEKVLRESIVQGQPRTHRPWKKIIIIVEGIYSMEGEICRLPEIVALKKKYKAYLYVDEAHSIGALGKTGRGVCEHWGVDPADIDILMGTFTKAFGSVGGYIASDQELIDHLRYKSYGTIYSTPLSPVCAQQALGALRVIMGEDGTNEGQKRIQRLHQNSNYFRTRLIEEGFHIFGDKDSPVVLMMLYYPAMMSELSRRLLERGIAIVVVGFPVTPLLLSRVRFCISSSHTIEALEEAVQIISDLGDKVGLKYAKYAKYLAPDY